MYEFVAIGPGTRQRWQRPIRPNEVVQLGRAPKKGWAVPWDMRISRSHAELTLKDDRLHVHRLEQARNSIYVNDKPSNDFTVGPGEAFRIGQTIFRLTVTAHAPDAPRADNNPAVPDTSLGGIAQQPEVQRLGAILARIDDEETCDEARTLEKPGPESSKGQDHAAAATSVDGAMFGDYEVVEQLHHSGAARVLKARHRYLQRWTAISVLASAAASDESIARFRRKARLIGSFDHENIVRAYDAGQSGEMHFLITELVDGLTLEAAVNCQPMDVSSIVSHLIEVARGLAHAHQRNVVHRDVKPAHVLVAREGGVKLIGWGKSWCNGDWSLSDYEGTGCVIGTQNFMSPEQVADSRDVDERSDIYSLGCTLFALLAAWNASSESVADDPRRSRSLATLDVDLPCGLDSVYRRMVEQRRTDRFQSMTEVIDALGSLG